MQGWWPSKRAPETSPIRDDLTLCPSSLMVT